MASQADVTEVFLNNAFVTTGTTGKRTRGKIPVFDNHDSWGAGRVDFWQPLCEPSVS